jgi:hypothetical protein
MSQHDMVIADQTAANFRADNNLMAQALASTSIGTSAPATPYTGQLWIDSTTSTAQVLAVYDGTDWITLGNINATSNLFTPVVDVISENTAAAGVTIDSVLCKDGDVDATIGAANPKAGTFTTLTSNGIDDNAAAESLQIDSNGIITTVNQPMVHAYIGTGGTNVTGDGTVYTLPFDSEITDQNSDFNTGTYTFTAPVDGTYLVCVTVRNGSCTGTSVGAQLKIVTSNRDYIIFNLIFDSGASLDINGAEQVDMDAGDTLTITESISNVNSGKAADINGGATNGCMLSIALLG